jgi:hypothetical protein
MDSVGGRAGDVHRIGVGFQLPFLLHDACQEGATLFNGFADVQEAGGLPAKGLVEHLFKLLIGLPALADVGQERFVVRP